MNCTTMFQEIPTQPQNSQIFRNVVKKTAHFIILLLCLVFFAGHENMNPCRDKAYVDFFESENQQLLNEQINLLAANENPDSICFINNRINELVTIFYQMRNYEPAWTINYGINYNFNQLTSLLDSSEYFGFPSNYWSIYQHDKKSLQLFDNLLNGNIGMNINILNLFVNIVIIYYVFVLLKKIFMKVRIML